MATRPQDAIRGSQSVGESRRWHFAGAVLDERSFELTVNGEEVEIERKPFEVLRFLLQHAGEVVTKDELYAAVWPGRFLSDTVLTKCIGRLRKALADEDESIIKTVYGYGYRFVTPLRVEMQRAPEPAHFDFKQGDHPQGRPLWSLQRRLGAGGHGEAWLAHHDKTREQRVFKFAIDETSLAALKREITLFRFLNDSLGERAHIVPLLDWNLEQPPCFLEMEYVAGGSLVEWAERSGGLPKIPLADRVQIAAQIAEALAAVHSVGVLHKDLKPSNVLIENTGDIQLADFGSGGVLDPKKLEAMGITRLGFTKTIAALGDSVGGTPLYLAPELLAGQPPTVKADIYALGVMLYQLVVGEFRKSMSPGWERDIADEVLRECIADAAHGDAAVRMADAAEIATRLRGLDEEREKRRREREEKAKREAAERALERLRARRTGLAIAFGVLIVGLLTSMLLYLDAREARNQAAAAATTSRAVADFLSKDMFSVVSTKPLRDLTVRELLESASSHLGDRLHRMPEAAAEIHAALGSAFWSIEQPHAAAEQLSQALTLFEQTGTDGSRNAAAVAAKLVTASGAAGTPPRNLERFENVLAASEASLGKSDPTVIALRLQIADARYALGVWQQSADEFDAVLADAQQAAADVRLLAQIYVKSGHALESLGNFTAAAERLRDAVHQLDRLGARDLDAATAHVFLGRSLIDTEEFAEAERELLLARELMRPWVVSDATAPVITLDYYLGLLRLRQDRTAEATRLLDKAVRGFAALDWIQTTDYTYEVRASLGEAYERAGNMGAAVESMSLALKASVATLGEQHPTTQLIRIGLARATLLQSGPVEAQAIAASIDSSVLERAAPGPDSLAMAELQRLNGLMAMRQNRLSEAQSKLADAARIYGIRYGATHARTRAIKEQLATAQRMAASAAGSKS